MMTIQNGTVATNDLEIRTATEEPLVDDKRNKNTGAKLFKTNDVVSKRIVKTLIIRYGIYANNFAEKM